MTAKGPTFPKVPATDFSQKKSAANFFNLYFYLTYIIHISPSFTAPTFSTSCSLHHHHHHHHQQQQQQHHHDHHVHHYFIIVTIIIVNIIIAILSSSSSSSISIYLTCIIYITCILPPTSST